MSDDGIVRNRDNVQSANSGSVEAAVSPPSMAAGLSRAGGAARSPLMSPQLPGVMDTLGRESPYIAGRLAGIALEQLSLSSSFDCAPDAARRDVGDAHAGAAIEAEPRRGPRLDALDARADGRRGARRRRARGSSGLKQGNG